MNVKHRIGIVLGICLATAILGFFVFRFETNEEAKTASKSELVDDTKIRNEILAMLEKSREIDFRKTDSGRIKSFCHDLDRVFAAFGPIEVVFGKTDYSFVGFSNYPISAVIWERKGILVSMELVDE